MQEKNEYIAFISYRHLDLKEAKWLQEKLEYFNMPTVVREENPDLPEHLRPIFRDETDLQLGYLSKNIQRALDMSRFLIVICSPNVMESTYVRDEINYFISIGKGMDIIPYIIDGVPYSNDVNECIPWPLHKLESRLLAANVSEMGRDYAAVKVIARILKLDILKLWPRYLIAEEEERQRKQRERDHLLSIQSRFLSESAWNQLSDGNAALARGLAFEALPRDEKYPERPYVADAERALRAACRCRNLILSDHKVAVTAIVCSQDGNYLASGDSSGVIKLWDLNLNKCIADIIGLTDRIEDLAFSPNGKWLAIASCDNKISICNTDSLELNHPFDIRKYPANHLCFSPDGSFLAVADISKISLYSTDFWYLMREINADDFFAFSSLQISDDGNLVAAINYSHSTVKLWKCDSGILFKTIGDNAIRNKGAFFSSDTKHIVIATNEECGILKLWSLDDGKCKKTLFFDGSFISDIVRCPEAGVLVSALDNCSVKILDDSTLETLFEKEMWSQPLLARLCFKKDLIISTSAKREIRLIEMVPYQNLRAEFLDELLLWPVWDARVELMARSNDCHSIQIFSIKDHSELSLIPSFGKVVASFVFPTIVQSDRLAFSSSDNIVRMWSLTDNKVIAQTPVLLGIPYGLCFANNDIDLFIATNDGRLYLWNCPNNNCTLLMEDLPDILLLKYDNAHVRLAAIANKMHPMVLELDGKTPPKVWDNLDAAYLSFSPDGEHLALACDRKIVVLDIESGSIVHSLKGFSDVVTQLSYSHDGRFLLSCHSGGSLRVWDLNHDDYTDLFGDQTSPVTSAAFSPNDKRITFTHSGGTIHSVRFDSWSELMDRARKLIDIHPLTNDEKERFLLI